MNTILGNGPTLNPATTPASAVLPILQGINGIFNRLNQVAPADVSADMSALTTYWSQVVADYQHGTTVAQVEAYIKANPPAGSDIMNAKIQHLEDYLATTCHINLSS